MCIYYSALLEQRFRNEKCWPFLLSFWAFVFVWVSFVSQAVSGAPAQLHPLLIQQALERWSPLRETRRKRVSAENSDAIHLNFKGKNRCLEKKIKQVLTLDMKKFSLTIITNVHVSHSNVIWLLEDITGLAAGFYRNISKLHPLLLISLLSTSTSRPECQNRFWVEITVVSLEFSTANELRLYLEPKSELRVSSTKSSLALSTFSFFLIFLTLHLVFLKPTWCHTS